MNKDIRVMYGLDTWMIASLVKHYGCITYAKKGLFRWRGYLKTTCAGAYPMLWTASVKTEEEAIRLINEARDEYKRVKI